MMQKTPSDIIPVSQWGLFAKDRPYVIAGPCSAESLDQILETAAELRKAGISVMRAGAWKPRTRPDSFEGKGPYALSWLSEAKKQTGISVCTEVACAVHVSRCLDAGIDMLWIGARTTANPFLVQEIADALRGCDIPVLVKNPPSNDAPLWLGAVERLYNAGLRRLGAVLRGVTPIAPQTWRNDPQWTMAAAMRTACPSLPIFCDPSHIAGRRDFIGVISQKALDLGLDGLMIESHCHPDRALSDSSQQLTPDGLVSVLANLKIRTLGSDDKVLETLRAQIDECDEQLLGLLAQRMRLSREIGALKKDNNIAIIQSPRWNSVLAKALARADELGLDRDCVKDIFNRIHQESVNVQ